MGLIDESDDLLVQTSLGVGDLVCFNQRRMLHGRNSFSQGRDGGIRHFQGCYVNIDDFASAYRMQRVMAGALHPGTECLGRIGNGAWSVFEECEDES